MAVAEFARHDGVRHAGDRQDDRRRRLERAVAAAQRDRDTVDSPEGDGHVEVVIVVEVADRDRRRLLVGVGEPGRRGRGLKRPIAGPEVNPVRGRDVEDPVVGKVADGDRRVTAPLEAGRLRKRLKGGQCWSQRGKKRVAPRAGEALHLEDVGARGDILVDHISRISGRDAVARYEQLAPAIVHRETELQAIGNIVGLCDQATV